MTNPTTPKTKPTNIPWLGDIPADWEVRRLKMLGKIIAGYAYKAEEYSDEDGVPIIRIGDIKKNLNLSETKKVPIKYLEITPEMIIEKGDILVALTGATIGKSQIYYLDEVALLNQRNAILRGETKLINQVFLKYFVES